MRIFFEIYLKNDYYHPWSPAIVNTLIYIKRVFSIIKNSTLDRQNNDSRTQIYKVMDKKCVFLRLKTSFLAVGNAVSFQNLHSGWLPTCCFNG